MNEHRSPADTIRERMDDLVSGQLSPWNAWLLRRRIARNPQYTREWSQLQDMHADLRRLAVVNSVNTHGNRSIPSALSSPTVRIGGIVMKKRTAVVAATLLTLFAVTGAIAARHFAPREGDCGFPGADRDFDWWYFHGTFRGRATVLDPKGQAINTIAVNGSAEDGTVLVKFSRHSKEVAHDTFQGMGRHAIHDAAGKLVGYVDLSPLTQKDNDRLAQDEQEIQEDMADFVRRPERVTPSDHKRGFYHVTALPGVIGGTWDELVAKDGFSNWHPHPYSWKSYGNVHVVARLRRDVETFVVVDQKSGEHPGSLARRTVVDEGESMPLMTPDQISRLSPEDQKALAMLPTRPVSTPETYWAVARQEGQSVATTEKGEWKKVLRSGKFEGYGHFVVREPATKKIVLTLDVTPPVTKSVLAPLNGNNPIKDTKVLPGWNNEK